MTKDSVKIPIAFKQLSHEALVNFWWTNALLKRVSRRFFRKHDSSEARFNMLVVLKRIPGPLTQNELSEKLLVDKSNLTGLLDGLEALGYIERRKVVGDRRSYHVALTAAGRRRIDQLESSYDREVSDIMAVFSDREQRELLRLTRKMRQALVDKELAR